jgi:hypothetical protein
LRAQLAGFPEYGSPSSPPKMYRQYSVSGTVVFQYHAGGLCSDPTIAGTVTYEGNGLSPYQYFADGTDTGGCPVETGDLTVTPSAGIGGSAYQQCFGPAPATMGSALSPEIISPTEWQLVPDVVGCQNIAGNAIELTGGDVLTWNLSDEDTEADALARATPLAGTDASSIWETRAEGGFQFTQETAKYALILSNLIVGMAYLVTVKWQRRTAVANPGVAGDQTYYGAWEDAETDTVNFTAASAAQVINGTWSDTNHDGLITPDEVTPVVDVPLLQGYAYQIESVFVEPA